MHCSVIYYYFVSMRLLIYEWHINYLQYITFSLTYLPIYLPTYFIYACSLTFATVVERLVYIDKQAENMRMFRPGICSKSNTNN